MYSVTTMVQLIILWLKGSFSFSFFSSFYLTLSHMLYVLWENNNQRAKIFIFFCHLCYSRSLMMMMFDEKQHKTRMKISQFKAAVVVVVVDNLSWQQYSHIFVKETRFCVKFTSSSHLCRDCSFLFAYTCFSTIELIWFIYICEHECGKWGLTLYKLSLNNIITMDALLELSNNGIKS